MSGKHIATVMNAWCGGCGHSSTWHSAGPCRHEKSYYDPDSGNYNAKSPCDCIVLDLENGHVEVLNFDMGDGGE